jgi:hypothetical protein
LALVAVEKGLGPTNADGEIEPLLVIQYGNTRRPEEIQAWKRE